MFKIEKVRCEHLDGIAEIEQLCFSDPWTRESLELFVGDSARALTATDESGRVLGYVGMLCVLDEGQIINVAVHPDARRKGIARALMDELFELCTELKITFLSLEVRESNVAARTLYAACGFEECGVRKNFYSHPIENAIVMTREYK